MALQILTLNGLERPKKRGTWFLDLESVVDQWVCHRMLTGGLAQWRGLISWGMLRVRRRVESVWPNTYGLAGNREREGERKGCNQEARGPLAGEKGMQWLGGWGSLLVPLVTRLWVTADLLSRRLLVGMGAEATRA